MSIVIARSRSLDADRNASFLTSSPAPRAISANSQARYVSASTLSGSTAKTCEYKSIAAFGSTKFVARARDSNDAVESSIPPVSDCPDKRWPDCRATSQPEPIATTITINRVSKFLRNRDNCAASRLVCETEILCGDSIRLMTSAVRAT